MISTFLIKGLLIGFSIAIPVGPIALLCIARTLEKGRISGLVTGMGAATADATYGLIAGFGLTFITRWMTSYEFWIHSIGGIFLFYLGLKTFLSKPAAKKAKLDEASLLKSYISTTFLTLTNPSTILSFMAIFAGLGIGSSSGSYFESSIFVLGVFLGSAAWWVILSTAISMLREKITKKHLAIGNKISGLLILGFGIVSIWGMF